MAEGVGSDRGPGPIEGGQKEREKIIKNWGHISFFSLFPFSLSAACKIRLVTCSVIDVGRRVILLHWGEIYHALTPPHVRETDAQGAPMAMRR